MESISNWKNEEKKSTNIKTTFFYLNMVSENQVKVRTRDKSFNETSLTDVNHSKIGWIVEAVQKKREKNNREMSTSVFVAHETHIVSHLEWNNHLFADFFL